MERANSAFSAWWSDGPTITRLIGSLTSTPSNRVMWHFGLSRVAEIDEIEIVRQPRSVADIADVLEIEVREVEPIKFPAQQVAQLVGTCAQATAHLLKLRSAGVRQARTPSLRHGHKLHQRLLRRHFSTERVRRVIDSK